MSDTSKRCQVPPGFSTGPFQSSCKGSYCNVFFFLMLGDMIFFEIPKTIYRISDDMNHHDQGYEPSSHSNIFAEQSWTTKKSSRVIPKSSQNGSYLSSIFSSQQITKSHPQNHQKSHKNPNMSQNLITFSQQKRLICVGPKRLSPKQGPAPRLEWLRLHRGRRRLRQGRQWWRSGGQLGRGQWRAGTVAGWPCHLFQKMWLQQNEEKNDGFKMFIFLIIWYDLSICECFLVGKNMLHIYHDSERMFQLHYNIDKHKVEFVAFV